MVAYRRTCTSQAEFEAGQSLPEQVTQWCEKWLNGGQWRQLENDADAAYVPTGDELTPAPA